MATFNISTVVRWATAKAPGILGASQRAAFDAAVGSAGGSNRWRESQRADRSYALMQFPAASEVPPKVFSAAAGSGLVAYDVPVIAIAVFPSVGEALPWLVEALGGPGAPAGVTSCEPCAGDGLAIEWDLDVTSAAAVLQLVDVELARFASGRTAELLSPLPPEWIARIAADGLKAPEISPERTLETLVQRAGLHV